MIKPRHGELYESNGPRALRGRRLQVPKIKMQIPYSYDLTCLKNDLFDSLGRRMVGAEK